MPGPDHNSTTPHQLPCDPADLERVKKAFPIAVAQDGDEQLVAALADLPLERVNAVIEQHRDTLCVAALKFQGEGKDIEVIARKTQRALLLRIASVAETASPLEAIDYLKPVVRIVEQADKVRLAMHERDKYANLPTINFTIGPGLALSYSATPAAQPVLDASNRAEVVTAVNDAADAQVLSFEVQPMGPATECESWD